ncbi:MAG: hypothetical protein JSV26_10615 [bacterium]|nr:MAG: hypothetical protein JSV26_10615 [bacterium]
MDPIKEKQGKMPEKWWKYFPNGSGPAFSREQVAFLEDLFINKACMVALHKGHRLKNRDECLDCAQRVERLVNIIRHLSEGQQDDAAPVALVQSP